MKLFEVRFSLRTQQHIKRFPQATRSLLARVPSDVLATALRIVNDYVRDRPFSLDSRPSRISSPVCFGSASNRPGFTGVMSFTFFHLILDLSTDVIALIPCCRKKKGGHDEEDYIKALEKETL